MAAYYFGINNGDNEYAAASGSSTTSKDVEIVIADVTKIPSVEELLLAIEKLENFVIRSNKAW
jgi:hypothetical protein